MALKDCWKENMVKEREREREREQKETETETERYRDRDRDRETESDRKLSIESQIVQNERKKKAIKRD